MKAMTKTIIITLLCLLVSVVSHATTNDMLLARLDSVLDHRVDYIQRKEKRLDLLRSRIAKANDNRERLSLYEAMYEEYYTFRYDSCMVYAEREYKLAKQIGNHRLEALSLMHRTVLLATNGCYSEGEKVFSKIDTTGFDRKMKYEYYWAGMWLYNYWSRYSDGNEFASVYDRKRNYFIAHAIAYADKGTANWYYLNAEYKNYADRDLKAAMRFYKKAIELTKENTRVYASATYVLAQCYKHFGNMQQYEHWILRSAISDQIIPLKENLALQEFAMYYFEKDHHNAGKSSRYINLSLEDAKFYNNRLRILEISRRLPTIMSAYEDQLYKSRNERTIQNYILGVLVTILIATVFFILRQNGKLNKRGEEVKKKNSELSVLNDKLSKSNAIREKYLHLYMDLCALYIDKLNNYRTLVVRKLKAHQTDSLLRSANSSRLSEQEASEFYTRFDKAFLELFPTFITEFNGLLREECKIEVPENGKLSTELRIYALIRLGVKESVEIATLLFYSPQTIYNYRSSMKKRAIKGDTLDEDVAKLCKYVSS